MRNRDAEYLKNKLNHEPVEFDSVAEFWHYIYRNLNMVELLEINYPKSFRCLFHDDNNPSASIFQNDEGVWLYKCHSGSCGLTMNIKQLIEKLGNFKSEYKAIEFIKTIYNLSIKETTWSIEQKANLDSILNNLSMGKFAELCPQASKNIRYVREMFATLVSVAKENVYGENYTNSDGDVVFFVSLGELAKIMKISLFRLNVISQRIAVLVYHDLIRKLDDDKIPEVLLKKAQALSIDKGANKRVNFYSIPSWVFEHLRGVEINGEKWKQYGYTIKGTSYEMFYRAEGIEIAQKIYPQHKKVKVKSADAEIVRDRTTSKVSDARVKKIVNSIKQLINDKGYTTEKEVVFYLSKVFRWEMTELQLRKMRGQLEKFNFKRIRANKEIKEKYGVVSNGYPFIIVKVI